MSPSIINTLIAYIHPLVYVVARSQFFNDRHHILFIMLYPFHRPPFRWFFISIGFVDLVDIFSLMAILLDLQQSARYDYIISGTRYISSYIIISYTFWSAVFLLPQCWSTTQKIFPCMPSCVQNRKLQRVSMCMSILSILF